MLVTLGVIFAKTGMVVTSFTHEQMSRTSTHQTELIFLFLLVIFPLIKAQSSASSNYKKKT
jgi:hypothetical protein